MRHVIVGAGPVGSATARELVNAGHQVRIISRGGGGPDLARVERVAADATDADRLIELARGAACLYNCANPPYHRWVELWPPLAGALLAAAQRCGTALVTMSNLYGYGPVDAPLTEDLPLAAPTVKGRVRARMWHEALAAHEAGRVRASEARASDFIGIGAQSIFTSMIAPAVLAGRRAWVPVSFDVPHSLTFLGDVAQTLATLGTDERSFGRAWHVPTPPATTLREPANRLAVLAGAPQPRLRTMSHAVLRMGGLVNTEARAFAEMRYQFDRPFVVDCTAAQQTFGLTPTALEDALRTML